MSTVIIPTCLRHVSKFSGDPRSGLHRTRQPREVLQSLINFSPSTSIL